MCVCVYLCMSGRGWGDVRRFDEALSIGGAARMGWFAATHLPSFYKMGSQKVC